MRKKKRILVFTDFESTRNIIVKSLTNKNYEVVETKSYQETIHELNGTRFNLLITDHDIKNNEGDKLIEYMRDLTSYMFTPIILLISSDKEKVKSKLKDYNIACYLNKPFDIQSFHSVIERLA